MLQGFFKDALRHSLQISMIYANTHIKSMKKLVFLQKVGFLARKPIISNEIVVFLMEIPKKQKKPIFSKSSTNQSTLETSNRLVLAEGKGIPLSEKKTTNVVFNTVARVNSFKMTPTPVSNRSHAVYWPAMSSRTVSVSGK